MPRKKRKKKKGQFRKRALSTAKFVTPIAISFI